VLEETMCSLTAILCRFN